MKQQNSLMTILNKNKIKRKQFYIGDLNLKIIVL